MSGIRSPRRIQSVTKESGKQTADPLTFTVKKSKKDPFLQMRIDEVVRQALEHEACGETASGVDVIRVDRSVWGMKARRIG